MMTLGVSYSIAQSNNLLVSNFSSSNINSSDLNPFDLNESDITNISTSQSNDIPESASHFQLNTLTNELNINVNSEVVYTKAELLCKTTNTTVQSLQINGGKESVDLTNTNPGTYYMILSNENGDILSEKLIIL